MYAFQVKGIKMVYADNAATTKLDIEAFEAMKPYLLEEYGNASQPYTFSRKVRLVLKEARKTIASCINASPEEIFFTSGGTESNNWALKEVGMPTDIKHVITSQIEHHSILNTCKHLEMIGVDISYIPVTKSGVVMVEEIEKCLTRERECVASCETKVVSIMFANNEIGTIQPVKEISAIAHRYGAIFHTDAVQAVGHTGIDVKEMGIDLLSASAHKFNGPKGIGFLYVRKGILISSHNDGGLQEYGKRAGTENIAAIVAMAYALKNNVVEIEQNEKKLIELEQIIENGLKNNSVHYVRNGANDHIPGNISLSFPGIEGETLLHRLDLMKICVSTGSACDSVNTQISHVLKAIQLEEDLARGTIRISLGKNNTKEEALIIVDALVKILQKQ